MLTQILAAVCAREMNRVHDSCWSETCSLKYNVPSLLSSLQRTHQSSGNQFKIYGESCGMQMKHWKRLQQDDKSSE
ncbi:hypothetical protein FOCC_FOCC016630 [Frankliniella occidentalis]|nr:hypothetical protein FOCC_FOCC016630 [Frankliniella occidentalis]